MIEKVCVDPGHGMSNRSKNVYDPGAVHVENGFQYTEAEIALRYALTLKDVFRARQVEVFMTRDDDSDHAPVGERAKNARNEGCEVFISLHLNDFDSDSANGFEVLFGDPDSQGLAEKLQEAVLAVNGLKDRKAKPRPDLAVLKFKGPAALIELGFIANDDDREVLLNPQKRKAICETIADVVMTG